MSNNEMLPAGIFTRPRGRWQEKIRIKHLLSDEDEPVEVLRAKGKQIAAILRRSRLFADEDVIEEFDDPECIDDMIDFNRILDDMYDECDRKRIWVE